MMIATPPRHDRMHLALRPLLLALRAENCLSLLDPVSPSQAERDTLSERMQLLQQQFHSEGLQQTPSVARQVCHLAGPLEAWASVWQSERNLPCQSCAGLLQRSDVILSSYHGGPSSFDPCTPLD